MNNKRYSLLLAQMEQYLDQIMYSEAKEYGVLFDAMRYAVLNGGKRLRGVLMLEIGEKCGLSLQQMLPFAATIEMIHASTLIHDDLPCMDNDDYRRGKPACHKEYGEDVALLAGDALYPYAISIILSCAKKYNYPGEILDAILVLTSLAGADGVYGGQILDKKYENERCTPEQLLHLHALKTGALFSACARIPCILGRVDAQTERTVCVYTKNLGLAFQVKDDLLDVEGNFETLGKATGADVNKSTFISIYGNQRSKEILDQLITKAKDAISDLPQNELLMWICDFVMNRNL